MAHLYATHIYICVAYKWPHICYTYVWPLVHMCSKWPHIVQHVCGHLLVLHLLHPSNMYVVRLVLHLPPSVTVASVQCGRHGRHMPFVVYTWWLEKNPILLVVKDISQGKTMKNMFYLSTSKGSDD